MEIWPRVFSANTLVYLVVRCTSNIDTYRVIKRSDRFTSRWLLIRPNGLMYALKGLSHEMDLAFDGICFWLVQGLNRGRGHFFNFCGAPMIL